MCTSLTFSSGSGNYFLARTMDFGFQLDGKPIVLPKNHKWQLQLGGEHVIKYGFVGTGRKLDEYFFADGVNEKGVAVAELYFLNEAKYSNEARKDKINLAPHELIMWILGEIESIEELRIKINEINLVNAEISLLGTTPPLHFIVTDKTGETVVIETNSGEIEIKENPVGVMTNSPELEWHLKNLNNYLAIQPTNFSNKKIDQYTLKPFGQGSGTFGLPGGFTSPERFARTVYMRALTEKGTTLGEGLNAIFQILNNVTIPKGVNIKDDGAVDFTQYRAIMDVSAQTYYFNPYDSQEVFSVVLTEELLNAKKPTEFDVDESFKIQALN